jgi:dUTPase
MFLSTHILKLNRQNNYYCNFRKPFSTMSSEPVLRVKRMSEHATVPYRASKGAAGYDLSSGSHILLHIMYNVNLNNSPRLCCACERKSTCTYRSYTCHPRRNVWTHRYASVYRKLTNSLAPRSSLAWKNFIDVGAGKILHTVCNGDSSSKSMQ